MKILVTGSQGYIGSVLAPLLVAEGHEVTGLDSHLYERCSYGEPTRGATFIRKDIRDVVATDLEGYDAVVHLAALSNDPFNDASEQAEVVKEEGGPEDCIEEAMGSCPVECIKWEED